MTMKGFYQIISVLFFWNVGVSAYSTVLLGPQSQEMLLLTAKVAARENIETYCVCASANQDACRVLMYGPDYAKARVDEAGKVQLVSSGDEIGDALEKANSLLLICDTSPVDEKTLTTLLDSTGTNLSSIVVLSKMGATKASGGAFGGGDNKKWMECEKLIKKVGDEKSLPVSIVRAGILKGGGSGREGEDIGLDKAYYNTIVFDSVEQAVTKAMDKFTLGAELSNGDTVELPNMFAKMGTKSSFDPIAYDTHRLAAAQAVVAAMLATQDDSIGNLDFTVSSASAEVPLTMEEWMEKLKSL